jgi:hypothetical protein
LLFVAQDEITGLELYPEWNKSTYIFGHPVDIVYSAFSCALNFIPFQAQWEISVELVLFSFPVEFIIIVFIKICFTS